MKLRARAGWAEALRAIPQEELDRDFAELQSFRETPHEWDATEWKWPNTDAKGNQPPRDFVQSAPDGRDTLLRRRLPPRGEAVQIYIPEFRD